MLNLIAINLKARNEICSSKGQLVAIGTITALTWSFKRIKYTWLYFTQVFDIGNFMLSVY